MELYCPCSENKGTDDLRSYCEADLRDCKVDLRLRFFISYMQNVGFLMARLNANCFNLLLKCHDICFLSSCVSFPLALASKSDQKLVCWEWLDCFINNCVILIHWSQFVTKQAMMHFFP